MKHIYSCLIAVLFVASNSYAMQSQTELQQDIFEDLPLDAAEIEARMVRNERSHQTFASAIQRNTYRQIPDGPLSVAAKTASNRCCQKAAHKLTRELEARKKRAHQNDFAPVRRSLDFSTESKNE